MIEPFLKNKSEKEKAFIKSREISKLKHDGSFDALNIRVEIIGEVRVIEINGQSGIEVFARAWKGTKQLGFGKDGSVEIERFRIFNPPILVDDPNGNIISEKIYEGNDIPIISRYREDPIEAVRQDLTHTISLIGKENTKIEKGKIGNTTSTFYPSAGANSPVDGNTANEGATWSTVHDAATGTGANTTSVGIFFGIRTDKAAGGGTVFTIGRSHFLFDTSAIGTDTISSATVSLFGDTLVDNLNDSVGIVQTNPAANNDLTTSDYDAFTVDSDTLGASALDMTSWSTTAYNDFALNATGISWINKTGITKLGLRTALDYAETASHANPPGTSQSYVGHKYADETGTANDPKLVVVHSVAVAGYASGSLALMGCGM